MFYYSMFGLSACVIINSCIENYRNPKGRVKKVNKNYYVVRNAGGAHSRNT